ncbi:MAG: hypothetical protein HQL99_06130 [Magnetococcales bacterium]|nr:hypothetical protein [Magnetococcales bacterium]
MTTPPSLPDLTALDQANLHLSRAMALAQLLECCGGGSIPLKASMLEMVAGMLGEELQIAQGTINSIFGLSCESKTRPVTK